VIEGGSFQTGPPEKELSTPLPPPMAPSACKWKDPVFKMWHENNQGSGQCPKH